MSDGMGRELAYLSSHATNRYFIPNWGIKLAIIMRCACPFGLRQSFIVSLPLFQSSYTKIIFIVYKQFL